MPIQKASPEFSIWCDSCDNLEDYAPFRSRAVAIKHFRSIGWHVGKKVKCPACASSVDTPNLPQSVNVSNVEAFDVLAHYNGNKYTTPNQPPQAAVGMRDKEQMNGAYPSKNNSG